jgi:hypothetical protein
MKKTIGIFVLVVIGSIVAVSVVATMNMIPVLTPSNQPQVTGHIYLGNITKPLFADHPLPNAITCDVPPQYNLYSTMPSQVTLFTGLPELPQYHTLLYTIIIHLPAGQMIKLPWSSLIQIPVQLPEVRPLPPIIAEPIQPPIAEPIQPPVFHIY